MNTKESKTDTNFNVLLNCLSIENGNICVNIKEKDKKFHNLQGHKIGMVKCTR